MQLIPLPFCLQKIDIFDCNFGHLLLKMLPSHSPKLREVSFDKLLCASPDSFETFPKLDVLSIGKFTAEFKPFLQNNQQLKSIELRDNCQLFNVFDFLAECIPSIESLSILHTFYANPSVTTLRKMGALKNLVIKKSERCVVIFSHMAAAQIPIEFLEIRGFESEAEPNIDLMSSISK